MTIQQQMANALGKDETRNGTWNSAILEGIKEISAGGGNKIEADDSKSSVEALSGGTINLTGDEYVKVNGVINYTASVITNDDKEAIALAIEPSDVESSLLYFKIKIAGVSNKDGFAQRMDYAVLVDNLGKYTEMKKPDITNTITSSAIASAGVVIINDTVTITVMGEPSTNFTWNVFVELVSSQL